MHTFFGRNMFTVILRPENGNNKERLNTAMEVRLGNLCIPLIIFVDYLVCSIHFPLALFPSFPGPDVYTVVCLFFVLSVHNLDYRYSR